MTTTTITAADATNGLVQTGGNDGTLTLRTGPSGAKVNALSIDAAGKGTILKAPICTDAPCFSANLVTAGISVTNTGLVPIVFNNTEGDATAAYSTSNGRFTPQVPGYYFITTEIQYATATYAVGATLLKNGAIYKWLSNTGVPSLSANGGVLVLLNGSTDYIQIGGFSATTQNTAAGSNIVHASGVLVRAT